MSALRAWLDAFRGAGSGLRGQGANTLDEQLVGLRIYQPLETTTEIVRMFFRVLRVIVTPPFSWVRESVVETSKALRLVTAPLLFSSMMYVLAFGSVLLGAIIYALGVPDRVGPGVYIAVLRELGTWLAYMILAGVVASALTGDLGARKIRDELDALSVLGVDQFRTLIVPRVVAIWFCGVIVSLLSVLTDTIGVLIVDQYTIHQPVGPQLQGVFLNMNVYDLVAVLLKHSILGIFIGVVACQQGLAARGGAEGVGRAVSTTVIITFVGIWLINSVFNTAYLTLVPDAISLKG